MGNRKGEDDELGRALDAYVDGLAAERGLTEDSAVNVRRAARRWCRFLGWSWEGFASATRWDAERWVGEMGARSLAASTVSGNLWCLRAVYERAVACGDVGEQAARLIDAAQDYEARSARCVALAAQYAWPRVAAQWKALYQGI